MRKLKYYTKLVLVHGGVLGVLWVVTAACWWCASKEDRKEFWKIVKELNQTIW